MSILYATYEFDLRRQAMADALAARPPRDEKIDELIARASVILEWYTRDLPSKESAT